MEIGDFWILKPKNEIIKPIFVKVIPGVVSVLDEEIMESVEGVYDPGTTPMELGCKRATSGGSLDMAQLGNTLKVGTKLVQLIIPSVITLSASLDVNRTSHSIPMEEMSFV